MSENDKVTHLTKEGLAKMEADLAERKNVRRLEIAERIKIALGFGDLSENAEYDAAKNEQAENEAEIAALELKLKNVVLIDNSHLDNSKVNLGSKVVLKDLQDGEVEEYYIVGSTEVNPEEGKISNESPVGSGLIGKRKGEIITVKAPMGMIKYEILEVK